MPKTAKRTTRIRVGNRGTQEIDTLRVWSRWVELRTWTITGWPRERGEPKPGERLCVLNAAGGDGPLSIVVDKASRIAGGMLRVWERLRRVRVEEGE